MSTSTAAWGRRSIQNTEQLPLVVYESRESFCTMPSRHPNRFSRKATVAPLSRWRIVSPAPKRSLIHSA